MTPTKKITPNPDNFMEYLKKIWDYKSLIWVFAVRDLKVKYAQTFLGLGWSILQPLTSILIYTFFFGYVLKWETEGLPFPLYVSSGLIGWNFFSYIIYQGSSSAQDAGNTIKKIYFPKSILPLSKVIVAMVELLLGALLLIPITIYYHVNISWNILLFPLAILFNTLCGLLPVFWIAVWAYKKRDLFHLLPYFVTFGIWLTPVFFSKSIYPNQVLFLVNINPMSNVIDMWRWMLFNYGCFNWNWLLSFLVVLVFTLIGMFVYNKKENEFSDFV
jgi:lipopolysaccharide transport system permease protein